MPNPRPAEPRIRSPPVIHERALLLGLLLAFTLLVRSATAPMITGSTVEASRFAAMRRPTPLPWDCASAAWARIDSISGMLIPAEAPQQPATAIRAQKLPNSGGIEIKMMAPATVKKARMIGLTIFDSRPAISAAPAPNSPAVDIRKPISVPVSWMLSR